VTGTGTGVETGATAGFDRDVERSAETERLSVDECWALLGEHSVGRIAFVSDGLPVVFPLNYRVVPVGGVPWIILRVRPGHSIDHAPPFVAFEIDGIDGTSHEGWSVLVRGALHHLDPHEVAQLPGAVDPEPWAGRDRTAWLAVRSRAVAGRRLRAPDREWAFSSDAYL
jgi:hypothetical protein